MSEHEKVTYYLSGMLLFLAFVGAGGACVGFRRPKNDVDRVAAQEACKCSYCCLLYRTDVEAADPENPGDSGWIPVG